MPGAALAGTAAAKAARTKARPWNKGIAAASATSEMTGLSSSGSVSQTSSQATKAGTVHAVGGGRTSQASFVAVGKASPA